MGSGQIDETIPDHPMAHINVILLFAAAIVLQVIAASLIPATRGFTAVLPAAASVPMGFASTPR